MLCKIGDVEVWRLLEIHGPFLRPEELFPTAGPEVGARIEELVPNSLCPTSGKLILPIQGFLLKSPSHNILVDSCVGNHKTHPDDPEWHGRSDTRFLSALAAAGLTTADVDYVLCTHLHADHIGWNTRLQDGRWVPTFANAQYLMPRADEELQRGRDSDTYKESILPVIEAGQTELVLEGHRLGDCITLIPTPGHTPGHVSVRIESGGKTALITGDALHTTAQCQHPEWHFKYDHDAESAVTSRISLLEQAAESGCLVLGHHFALPSLGRVSAAGNAFKWEDLD